MCKECARERELNIKLEEERYVENFIDYVEAYLQLTRPDEQKGVRELYDDFKKQGYKRQKTSHQESFRMCISEYSNGLASTIDFKFNREKKQDKRLSNHNFPLHLPQKTKHLFSGIKWYYINFQWFLRNATNQRWGDILNEALGAVESTLENIRETNLHKN